MNTVCIYNLPNIVISIFNEVEMCSYYDFFVFIRQNLTCALYKDGPQPQVIENYSYLFNLRPRIYKSWYLNSHFIPNNSRLMKLINPLTAKLFNLNFHPLEVVSRWRDPQLQVSVYYI